MQVSEEELKQIFRQHLGGLDPYDFQWQTAQHLLAGRSVILQAPTGAGKTLAALLPFVAARVLEKERNAEPGTIFPMQMMHAAPMRVLVDEFYKKAGDLSLKEKLDIGLSRQTGENREDDKLTSNLIYMTVDQLLSSFLGIPYSLSNGQANINAGAVIGSYLVFDEFHLFDPDNSLATSLQMLRWLSKLTPFLLMTATVSQTMLDSIRDEINGGESSPYRVEAVKVSSDELETIPSQKGKQRIFHAANGAMSATSILAQHQSRSIVVCNTVDRAQTIYRDLLQADSKRTRQNTMLLHARFLTEDRASKIDKLQAIFGKDAWDYPSKSAVPASAEVETLRRDFVLVATQVIEVGVDLSCERLHTDVAPGSAILQRAGRCARFENQSGEVYVYTPRDEEQQPTYLPYQGSQRETSIAAMEALKARGVAHMGFADEQEFINSVHGATDEAMLTRLRSDGYNRQRDMVKTIRGVIRANAPKLIRDADSISVLISPDPDNDPEVLKRETFSIYQGSIFGLLNKTAELPDWCLRYYIQEDSDEHQGEVQISWHDVRQPLKKSQKEHPHQTDDIWMSPVLALNPAYATYDAEYGLRIYPQVGIADRNWDTPSKQKTQQSEMINSVYQIETFYQHGYGTLHCFETNHATKLAHIAARLDEMLELDKGTIMKIARFTVSLHDLGKLSQGWQQWAHLYHQTIGEPVDEAIVLAHTHYDKSNKRHYWIERNLPIQRPPHAGEGAVIAHALFTEMAYILNLSEDNTDYLRRAVVSAIARHHTAKLTSAKTFNLYQPPSNNGKVNKQCVPQTVAAVLAAIPLALPHSLAWLTNSTLPALELDSLITEDATETLLYVLFARVLRLSDQESQAANQEGGHLPHLETLNRVDEIVSPLP